MIMIKKIGGLIILLGLCAFVKVTKCAVEAKSVVKKLKGGSWKYVNSFTKDTTFILNISDFGAISMPNYLRFESSNDNVELKNKVTSLPNLLKRRKEDLFYNTKCIMSFGADKYTAYPISVCEKDSTGKIKQLSIYHQFMADKSPPFKAYHAISSVCNDSLIVIQYKYSGNSWGASVHCEHLFIRVKE